MANFILRVQNGIFHATLDVPVAILFRIEFWCIGWQKFHMNIGMLLQKCLHDLGFMGARSIPDQDERALDLAHKVLQSDQQFFGIDRALKMSFVDLARDRQTCHRRYFSAKPGYSFQLRRLAFGRPGETDRLCIGEPKFVFKYDLCAEPPRFFLSWANPGATRLGSSLRYVRSLVDLAFAHSSPDHPING